MYNFGICGDNNQRIFLRAINYIEHQISSSQTKNNSDSIELDLQKTLIVIMTTRPHRKIYSYFYTKNSSPIIRYLHMAPMRCRIISPFFKHSPIKSTAKIEYPNISSILQSFATIMSYNNLKNMKRLVNLLSSYLTYIGVSYVIVPCDIRYDYLGDIDGCDQFILTNKFKQAPYGHPLEEGSKAYAEYLYEKLKASICEISKSDKVMNFD